MYNVCDTRDQRVCPSPKTYRTFAACPARCYERAVRYLARSQGTVREGGDTRLANQMGLSATGGCLGPRVCSRHCGPPAPIGQSLQTPELLLIGAEWVREAYTQKRVQMGHALQTF